MSRFLLSIFIILILPSAVLAQFNRQGNQRSGKFAIKKNKVRKEYVFGLGACNFLGELGGANKTGTNFINDLELSATRPSFSIGIRNKFRPRWAWRVGFYYQLLSGSDKLTQEPYRRNRNLSFRSHIFELSGQFEFYLTPESHVRLYKYKKGKRDDIQVYIFAGAGGFYFNPKAKYNGAWVSLQPLGTEGQGLEGAPTKYSRIAFCIPYGLGAKYVYDKNWGIGLELGIRKTFTDYIDDVSGVYYDNSQILAARGQTAADLADPSLYNYPEEFGGNASGYNQTTSGQQRGDPADYDSFMFMNITLAYKIPYRKKTRSKF